MDDSCVSISDIEKSAIELRTLRNMTVFNISGKHNVLKYRLINGKFYFSVNSNLELHESSSFQRIGNVTVHRSGTVYSFYGKYAEYYPRVYLNLEFDDVKPIKRGVKRIGKFNFSPKNEITFIVGEKRFLKAKEENENIREELNTIRAKIISAGYASIGLMIADLQKMKKDIAKIKEIIE